MANALGNGYLNAAYWTKVMQEVRYKELVAMKICNVDLRAVLKNGDTVHKPYRSSVVGQSYTKGTAFTVQDISATDDTLVVNITRVAPFYLDDVDEIQNSFSTADEFAADCMDRLNRFVDADVLAEYANATSTVKNNDVGGATAVAIAPTTSNINKIFTSAGKKLNTLNVKKDQRFAIIGPSMLEVIQQYLAGKDTTFGDTVGANGLVGSRFGFEIYLSNNLAYSATWTPADNPSNTQTITINGVTLTFVSTIGTTAGNVLIGDTTADTLDNLVTLLNTPQTTAATGVALSVASRALLEGAVATDGTTYLGLVLPGCSECVLATSVAADAWSSEVSHCLFGRKGAIDLVMQAKPQIEFKDVSDKLGKNIAPWMLYGLKTFNNAKDLLVDVWIDGSAI